MGLPRFFGGMARHGARVEIVVLHEALGGGRARRRIDVLRGDPGRRRPRARFMGALGVAHLDGHALLLVEGKAIAPPVGVRVEAVPHPPQELFGGAHLLRLARHEDPEAHQLPPCAEGLRGIVAHAEARARSPARSVEVANAARAALHVGLEQVHRASEAGVTPGRLVVQALHEGGERAAVEEPAPRAIEQLRHQRLIAGDGAQIEQRRGRRQIVLRERQRLVGVHHLVADGEPRVPQRVEERLHEARRGLAVPRARRDHDAHVGVAPEGHRAAPVAPGRGEAQVLRAPHRRRGRREEGAHEAIQHLPVATPERDAVLSGGQAAREVGAMAHEVVPELATERGRNLDQAVGLGGHVAVGARAEAVVRRRAAVRGFGRGRGASGAALLSLRS
jgi:hypothetical protein